MASTILTRTPSSAGNRKTMTFSAWLKRSGISTGRIFSTSYSGENNQFWIKFGSETLGVYSRTGGTYTMAFDTTAKYRDTNGWYHLVVAIDTTQSTQADRLKVYVNGSLVSGNLSTAPSLNLDVEWNVAQPNDIGGKSDTNGEYFDGSMSHVHFCDGLALAPTVFGSTDSATGEWKINTNPSFTLGTNGFTILKDGNTITDQSSNSNNFSLDSGTLTKTEDSPSNVFATFNPLLVPTNGTVLFTNGNNSIRTSNSQQQGACSTLGASSGKFYWECKQTANSAGTNGNILIAPYFPFEIATRSAYSASGFKGAISYGSHGGVYIGDAEWNTTTGSNSNASGSWSTYTVGDIVSVALDLDNNYVYFGKNGAWQNSGNPESGSNGTGGISLNVSSSYTKADGEFYFFGTADQGSSSYANYDANFGNGYFGTTAVSSAGTNASGNGIFEYDVPTGYTALSTKGLNL